MQRFLLLLLVCIAVSAVMVPLAGASAGESGGIRPDAMIQKR